MAWIRCVGCGKKMELSPLDAGRRLLCLACGTANDAPLIIPQESALAALPQAEPVPSSQTSAVRDQQLANLEASLRFWRGMGFVGVATLILIVLAAVVYYLIDRDRGPVPPQQQANATEVNKVPVAPDTTRPSNPRPAGNDTPPATQPAQDIGSAILKMLERDAELARALNPEPRRTPTPPVPEPEKVVSNPLVPNPLIPNPVVPNPGFTDPPVRNPLVDPQPEPRGRPPVRPIEMPRGEVTDEEIGRAIIKAAEFLLGQFQDSQLRQIRNNAPEAREAGLNALVVYALLQAGQAVNDERLNVRARTLKALVDRMREMPIQGSAETYARGIRATALAVHNRAEDRNALKEDVAWLLKATQNGGYTYQAQGARYGRSWDNSNSQYGVLGVWSGAEVGVEVPRTYWAQVQNHWYECQCENGQWDYTMGNTRGSLSMTLAGVASLFVTHDYLDAADFGKSVGREPFSRGLKRGLTWLEEGDNAIRIDGMIPAYTLFGLERVGLASGFKYFGDNDWYRVLAAQVIAQQAPDGSWTSFNMGERGRGFRGVMGAADLVSTSYCLLFLARGRHPILMNKLRWDAPQAKTGGYWANRPRDVANLARFASRELERPLNWQVVPLNRPWQDWLDAPILYIASHVPVPLTQPEYDRLRAYVEAGGMIFLQADGGAPAFDAFTRDFAKQVTPSYEWQDVPPDHELYTVSFQVNPRPKLRYVTNGARILLLYSPEDIAQHYQQRAEKPKRNYFELGTNIFIYASGKTDLRNRLASPYLPPPARANPTYFVKLARVKYAGAWNPEPYAFTRFAHLMTYQTGYGVEVIEVDLAALDPKTHPIAHLTGAAAYNFSESQVQAIKRYVEGGGTLLVDPVGGPGAFNSSIEQALDRAFPDPAARVAIDAIHPILFGNRPGMDPLPRPIVRTYTDQKLGRKAARLFRYKAGQGRVIHSPLDITSGLLGTNPWGIAGYRPAYAQSLMKNMLLWAIDGAPE